MGGFTAPRNSRSFRLGTDAVNRAKRHRHSAARTRAVVAVRATTRAVSPDDTDRTPTVGQVWRDALADRPCP